MKIEITKKINQIGTKENLVRTEMKNITMVIETTTVVTETTNLIEVIEVTAINEMIVVIEEVENNKKEKNTHLTQIQILESSI